MDRDGGELLASVIALLGDLTEKMVFTGGAVAGLLVDQPRAVSPRFTDDADAILEATAESYVVIQQRLLDLGWSPDTELMCRFRQGFLTMDVMPTDGSVLGFTNRWFALGYRTAREEKWSGRPVRIIAPAVFLATKLEAYRDRGGDDPVTSHDLEDLFYVVAGRESIVAEVAQVQSDCRAFIVRTIRDLLADSETWLAMEGAMAHHPEKTGETLGQRLRDIASLEGGDTPDLRKYRSVRLEKRQ